MIAAIVLAAGSSSRMGKPKQTLPLAGKPMLERVLGTYRRAKVDEVVVVLGAHAAQIRHRVRFEKEKIVSNPLHRRGMSGSLRLGLTAAKGADAVIIALGDQPFLSPDTINRMIEVYSKTKGPVVVPVYRGVRGNPVLFDRSLFPEIRRLRGDRGAKSVVERHRGSLREVDVEDRGVLIDLDTPLDYYNAIRARAT